MAETNEEATRRLMAEQQEKEYEALTQDLPKHSSAEE